jgi:predicted ribosome quality control (RQC) complex YloA/Tae2 family protein
MYADIEREIARMENKAQELTETISGLRRRNDDPEQKLSRVINKLHEVQESLRTARHLLP